MDSYTLEAAGLFRANPQAVVMNNVRIVDADTPGTPQTDTLADYDAAAATTISGVRYTGKDGVSNLVPFTTTNSKTGQKTAYTVPANATAQELQDAIWGIIYQHEVNAVVSVAKSGTEFTIVHTGSGSLTDLVVDGADVDFSRAAVSGVSITSEKPSTKKAKKTA